MVWLHNPFFASPPGLGTAGSATSGSSPLPTHTHSHRRGDAASDAEAGLVGQNASRSPSTATPSADLDRATLSGAGVPAGHSASGSTAAGDEEGLAKKEEAGGDPDGGERSAGGAGAAAAAGGTEGGAVDDHRNHLHYRLGLAQTPHLPRIHIHHHLHEMRVPSERWTAHQLFYTFVLDGIGAAIISGAINFGIAYAMYHNQDTPKHPHPIHLFQLRNTLAGDAGVTTIIQCIITWVIEVILVNMDLKSGHVQALGFLPEPTSRFGRWFMFLDRRRQLNEPGSFWHWFWFINSQVVRGLLTAIPAFILMWAPAVGILTAVGDRCGGDWCFHRRWAPQIFKLVYGAVLGLITTPLYTVFWLARCGWALKTNEGHYGER